MKPRAIVPVLAALVFLVTSSPVFAQVLQVLPLFESRCAQCHGGNAAERRAPDRTMLAQMTTELGSNAPACYTVGSPINWDASPNCTRALEYVRSRHGPGNNDWVRGKRQQSFIYAAIKRVISRGSGSNFDSLRASALSNSTDFYTTLPTDSASALELFNLLSGATMPNQAVLKPTT